MYLLSIRLPKPPAAYASAWTTVHLEEECDCVDEWELLTNACTYASSGETQLHCSDLGIIEKNQLSLFPDLIGVSLSYSLVARDWEIAATSRSTGNEAAAHNATTKKL